MKKIKEIREIEEGDILAEPIINSFGMLLLPGGTPLTQSHMRMLQMWNIKRIHIKIDMDDYENWLNDDLLSWGYNSFLKRIDWQPVSDIEKDYFNLGVINEARKVMLESQKKK